MQIMEEIAFGGKWLVVSRARSAPELLHIEGRWRMTARTALLGEATLAGPPICPPASDCNVRKPCRRQNAEPSHRTGHPIGKFAPTPALEQALMPGLLRQTPNFQSGPGRI